jgi:two-component system sensor histidine kinase/response regulator
MDLERTSGLSLAAGIRADPASRATRILLLSSDRLAADPRQRREAGVAYQLIKPVRAGDLFECIATRPRKGVAVAPVAEALVPVRQVSAGTRQRRVLLAEDNPVNVEVATAMLDSLGLEVSCARNGEEALQAVREGQYDVVLMDCQMPVMDGFAATSEIRRFERDNGRARKVPVIAITANALQGDRESCLAAGMDDYLSKPFTQQQLGAVIGRWIALPLASTVHHAEQRPALPPQALELVQREAVMREAVMRDPVMRDPVMRDPVMRDPVIRDPVMRDPVHPSPGRPILAKPVAGARDVINQHALDNIRALSADRGAALVQRVINAYVDDTPQHLQTLRRAIAGLDAGNLRKVAHSLKSSSANVGAETLAQMCKDMEHLGRTDTTEGAAGILTDMEHEFQAVRHSLSAILEKEH